MDEQPTSVNAGKAPAEPQTAQHESRQSYLETVLSYPPHSAGPSTVAYEPYPTYRRATYRPKPLSSALGMGNATNDTLVPPVSGESFASAAIPSLHDYPSAAFCIDCNNCGKSIPNEHYHCSICDDGDFDLCQSCVDHGVSCDGEEHWLIKRSIRGGLVIPSVTETIAPRDVKKTTGVQEVKQPLPANENEDESIAERTCNICIRGNVPFATDALFDANTL